MDENVKQKGENPCPLSTGLCRIRGRFISELQTGEAMTGLVFCLRLRKLFLNDLLIGAVPSLLPASPPHSGCTLLRNRDTGIPILLAVISTCGDLVSHDALRES